MLDCVTLERRNVVPTVVFLHRKKKKYTHSCAMNLSLLSKD